MSYSIRNATCHFLLVYFLIFIGSNVTSDILLTTLMTLKLHATNGIGCCILWNSCTN
jgi:hypothetical protein